VYDGDTAAFTASMQTLKILLNAVVSDKGAHFATADIKDYYLGTPLVDKQGSPASEYMRINLKHIPLDVQEKYNMAEYIHNDHVYIEINKSIYGLPQSGRLSQDRLIKHLKQHDYHQCPNTPALFRHKSKISPLHLWLMTSASSTRTHAICSAISGCNYRVPSQQHAIGLPQ
jgi:hypothetical protein